MSIFDQYIEAIKKSNIEEEFEKFKIIFNNSENIIVLGNGGSNAIASHMSQDFVKFHNKKSLCFSDPSMLTCFINDFGMEVAYRKFLEAYATEQTLVILISSAGNSKNILNCVEYCSDNKINYGVLTAFKSDNPVRARAYDAKFNYYIDTMSYGVAECVHQIFLHGIVEQSTALT